jgi:aldehyde:ferredoxin oxidoreductase
MIAHRQNDVGQYAALGVKRLAEYLGKGTEDYAVHSKGQEYAAHRRANSPEGAVGYLTSNRGACHLNSGSASGNNSGPMNNSLVICSSGGGALRNIGIPNLLAAITGQPWDQDKYNLTGERIFNLEKAFNYREGFRREDDEWVPARFYTEAPTIGRAKGITWDPKIVSAALDKNYTEHGWDVKTSKPSQEKLTQLGLDYAWKGIANL